MAALFTGTRYSYPLTITDAAAATRVRWSAWRDANVSVTPASIYEWKLFRRWR